MTWTSQPEIEGGEGREIVSNGALIATVYNPTDAPLIAAAPDLLAALETALEMLIDSWGDEQIAAGDDQVANVIKTAIAKAKGN